MSGTYQPQFQSSFKEFSEERVPKNYTVGLEYHNDIIIDSNDRVLNAAGTDYLQQAVDFNINASTNIDRIYRVGLSEFYMYYDVPNCNPRNNFFRIEGSLGNFNIVVAEGYYGTTALLFAAMQTALNAQAAPYAPWTVAAGSLGQTTLTATAGTFNVVCSGGPSAGFNPKQFNLMGIDTTFASASSQTLFRPTLIYTRYVDITSNAITKFQRSDTTTSNRPSNLVVRVPVTQALSSTPQVLNVRYENIKFIKYTQGASISNIDVRIYDEYGETLYNTSVGSFYVGLILRVINQLQH